MKKLFAYSAEQSIKILQNSTVCAYWLHIHYLSVLGSMEVKDHIRFTVVRRRGIMHDIEFDLCNKPKLQADWIPLLRFIPALSFSMLSSNWSARRQTKGPSLGSARVDRLSIVLMLSTNRGDKCSKIIAKDRMNLILLINLNPRAVCIAD